MKVSLMELCRSNGEAEAKLDFLKVLSDALEKQEAETLGKDGCLKLATVAWKCGFQACNKVVVNAVKRGDIDITTEIEGTLHQFIADR